MKRVEKIIDWCEANGYTAMLSKNNRTRYTGSPHTLLLLCANQVHEIGNMLEKAYPESSKRLKKLAEDIANEQYAILDDPPDNLDRFTASMN